MKRILLILGILLLTGCSQSNNDVSDTQFISGTIIEVSEDQILVEDVEKTYEFNYETETFNKGDVIKIAYSNKLPTDLDSQNIIEHTKASIMVGVVQEISEQSFLIHVEESPYIIHSDLQVAIGDQIKVTYSEVMESYPMQVRPHSVELISSELSDEVLKEEVEYNEEETEVIDQKSTDEKVDQEDNSVKSKDVEENDVSETEASDISEVMTSAVVSSASKTSVPVEGLKEETSTMITIDPREQVSGYLGVFPSSIIVNVGIANINEVFAIELPSKEYKLTVNDHFELHGEGGTTPYYIGLVAFEAGLYQLEATNGSETILFEIKVSKY